MARLWISFEAIHGFFTRSRTRVGDDGLVGKGFEQIDLRRGEGTHLGATCIQCSDDLGSLSKRNNQKCARVAAAISLLRSLTTSLIEAADASVDLSLAGWVKYDSFMLTVFFVLSTMLQRAHNSTTCSAVGSKRGTSTWI